MSELMEVIVKLMMRLLRNKRDLYAETRIVTVIAEMRAFSAK